MHTYRSGLPIRLGPITLIANLSSAVEGENRTGLKMVCPEHKCFVHQELVCNDENHKVERDQTLRGAITEEGMRIVAPQETPTFDASDTFDLIPVPAEALETHTTPDKSVFYVLPKPKSGSEEAWVVLNEIVKDKKTAYVVSGAIRKGKKNLFRLESFNGYMALRQLRFPHQVREAPQLPEHSTPKATINTFKKLAKEFAEKTKVEWDKFDSSDEYEERLKEFIGQGELVAAPVGATEKKGSTTKQDVGSALDMMEELKKAIEGGS